VSLGENPGGWKPYAREITNARGTFEHLQIPGLDVPGPPLHSMERADDDAGLTEATSNDGPIAVWP
jgi:hypothetical protein